MTDDVFYAKAKIGEALCVVIRTSFFCANGVQEY